MSLSLSVIIPSLNGATHLRECLPSVCAAALKSPIPTEIIVIDDNSKDDTQDLLKSTFPQVTAVKNPKQGISSARNFGVLNSKGSVLFFCDNDVFLEADYFLKALPYLSPDMFCVASAGYSAYTGKQIDGVKLIKYRRGFLRFTENILNDALKDEASYLSFGVQGAYFFCGRKKFLELNGFDELYDPYIFEESDFAYRGLKRGWETTYAPNLNPRHKCGGTINSKRNKRAKYLSKRNRILFMWKNITDKALLSRHLPFTFLTPRALIDCLGKLSELKIKRSEEKRLSTVSDADILKKCKEYAAHISLKL